MPYEGLSEPIITGLIGYDNNHRLNDPPPGSCKFITGIMNKCLNRNPSGRPTFIQIQKMIDDFRQKNPVRRDLWEDK